MCTPRGSCGPPHTHNTICNNRQNHKYREVTSYVTAGCSSYPLNLHFGIFVPQVLDYLCKQESFGKQSPELLCWKILSSWRRHLMLAPSEPRFGLQVSPQPDFLLQAVHFDMKSYQMLFFDGVQNAVCFLAEHAIIPAGNFHKFVRQALPHKSSSWP